MAHKAHHFPRIREGPPTHNTLFTLEAHSLAIDNRGGDEDPYHAYHAYHAHFADGSPAGIRAENRLEVMPRD